MVKILLWWLIFWLTGLFAYLMYDFGLLIQFYTQDMTMLTYLITVLFAATTCSVGYKCYVGHRDYSIEWFVSDIVITLGMIGTIVGFIIMLSGTFDTLKIADANSVRLLIASMSKGLYTALNTTLAGLISSVIIKAQLVVCDDQ